MGVFGPAREEFHEQKFPPAVGLVNHSMALASCPQNHVQRDSPSSRGGEALVVTFPWAHKGAHLSVVLQQLSLWLAHWEMSWYLLDKSS